MGLIGALTGLGGLMRNAEGLAEVFVAARNGQGSIVARALYIVTIL